VTGASSGIGEGFAEELADDGVDLILVGRNMEALERVAANVRSVGVRADVVAADLATDDGVETVVSALRVAEPPVDLVVNNAGLGQWGWFKDLPLEGAVATMRVNDEALVRLTHAAVPLMLERGPGALVQVSSMAAAGPGPQQAVYAASKAFVASFGQALSLELAATGVTCTTVLPGFTRSNYFARAGLEVNLPDDRWMTARELARLALDGARAGRPLVIPGTRNRLKIAIATPFPSLALGQAKRRTRQVIGGARQLVRTARRTPRTVAPPAAE
jgi:short-subunit dehydrogenase